MEREPFTITVDGATIDEQTVEITPQMTVHDLRREIGADDAYVPQLQREDSDRVTYLEHPDAPVYDEAKDADRIFFSFPPDIE